MGECYIPSTRSINLINNKEYVILWGTQRNIEADAKWAQRKEGLVKGTSENRHLSEPN